MSPAPGPNDLTRQQLDELDVLLQRMLGLPLDPPAPTPAAPAFAAPPLPDLPPGWRLDAGVLKRPDPHAGVALTPAFVPLAAVGAVADRPTGLRRPPVVEADDAAADEPFPRRFAPPTEGTGLPTGPFARTLRGADAPALPPDFRPTVFVEPEPEPAFAVAAEPVRAAPAAPPAARVPAALWPLFACNWVLETACGLAGPVGAVAVRPAGKHVLGGLGVVLLVGAAAWTARGFGVVDFPVPARPAWATAGR